MSESIKCKISWLYNGEKGVYIANDGFWIDESGLNTYWWEEGNGACDCNRSIYFGLAEKYPEKCIQEEVCFPCGDTIEILKIAQIKEKKD